MTQPVGAVADRTGPARQGRRLSLDTKRTLVGVAIFVGVLLVFLTQTRLRATLLKFETIERAQTARGRSAFSQVVDPETSPSPFRWLAYGINLWDANAIGMFFAVLMGGAAVGALASTARLGDLLRRRGPVGAGVGGVMGVPLFMCSACSAPVSVGFYRVGAGLETSLGMLFGSALFNPVGIVAIFIVFPTRMALARVAFGLAALLVLAPAVARWHRRRLLATGGVEVCDLPGVDVGARAAVEGGTWPQAVRQGVVGWVNNTIDVAWRLVPPMLVATLGVGLVFAVAPPQYLSDRVGTGLLAIVLAAATGTLLQLPTLFEIPLVLGVMALGLDAGPATALLVTAPSAGVVTVAITRSVLGWRTPALLLAGTFIGGVAAGAVVGLL